MGIADSTRTLLVLRSRDDMASSTALRAPASLTEVHGMARVLCHFRTRDLSQIQRALRAIPDHLWIESKIILSRRIRLVYQAAYQAGDKAERRRLSGLSLLLDEESARRHDA